MNLDEYIKKTNELKLEFDQRQSAIDRYYAFSQNSVEIGSVITDGNIKIRVEEIKYTKSSYASKFPHCVYSGPVLKKNGDIRKDGSFGRILAPNVVGNK